MMVANTDVLAANPDLGKALVGAWYETKALMSGDGAWRLPFVQHAAHQFGSTVRCQTGILVDVHSVPRRIAKASATSASPDRAGWTTY